MALDFILNEIGKTREPIDHVSIPVPIGQVWTVPLKDDLYQVQIRDFSDSYATEIKKANARVLINGSKQVHATLQLSETEGCFNVKLTAEEAAITSRKLCDCYVVVVKPIYAFEDWDIAADTMYRSAEIMANELLERSQPINQIAKVLMTVDAAVQRWQDYADNPETIPETDLEGKSLDELAASARHAFWLEAQAALTKLAEKAEKACLVEPIDAQELQRLQRKSRVLMISAALGISPKSLFFSVLSQANIIKIWSAIVDILNKDVSDEPDPMDSEPVAKPEPEGDKKKPSPPPKEKAATSKK